MTQYFLIDQTEPKLLPHEKQLSLEEMQTVVGGYIQAVYKRFPDHSIVVVCNEEGAVLDPPLPVACCGLPTNEAIHGNYLIMGMIKTEDDYEFCGLTPEQVAIVQELLIPIPAVYIQGI